jgi:translocation and assembly module TamA
VFVKNRISVPDTILFRAGGDGSVARLRLPTLGPTRNDAVVGGRVLATGSVELEHPLSNKLPGLLGAVFVDAGNAADHWRDLRPVFGYGVGVHYRSPIGPLRVDLAYGEDVKQFRLHISIGITFSAP